MSTRWLLSHLDGGELGNRLVTYAWLYALACEHRASFTNLGFWRYARFFDLPDDLVVKPWEARKPHTQSAIRWLAERSLRSIRSVRPFEQWVQRRCRFDGDLVFDVHSLTRRGLAFASSRLAHTWLFQSVFQLQHDGVPGRPQRALNIATRKGWACPVGDPSVLGRHADAVRAHLRPNVNIRAEVAAFLDPLRRKRSHLVGIHVRRGDYRAYREGRWYFEDDVYHAVMKSFAELLGPDVGFVIASNTTVAVEAFSPLSAVSAPGHLVLDMFSLAGCDYIAGPPSTFSGCASFFGGKPIFWITEATARPNDLSSLKVWLPQLY